MGSLWATHSLSGFFNQMLWLKQNYAAMNVMPYGSVIGGYGRLFEGPGGVEALVRGLLVTCIALPAILPPLAIGVWGILLLRRKASLVNHAREHAWEVALLLAVSVALVVSTFPRADMMHLAFICALPYALAAAGLAQLLSVRAGAILAFTVIPFALVFSVER